jgi:hypothetical protein
MFDNHFSTSGQVLQWNGTTWACSNAGTGTITGVTAGTDLTGGGTGGSVTLNLDTTKVPLLAARNTFTGKQTVNGTLTVVTSSDYIPLSLSDSSDFGTWLQLGNSSAGGHTWNILSAGSGNAEGVGNPRYHRLHRLEHNLAGGQCKRWWYLNQERRIVQD